MLCLPYLTRTSSTLSLSHRSLSFADIAEQVAPPSGESEQLENHAVAGEHALPVADIAPTPLIE